ncbi:MAG: glycosyltransferase family 61 protein [Halobacteriales archaeon]|nr:glycosyltransferase family 61 protein [Halobacteriales archaeon]
MPDSDSAFRRAMRIWGRDGFLALLRVAVRAKLIRPVTNRLWDGSFLTTEEVQRRCAEEGNLWEYDGEFDSDEIRDELFSRHDDSDYLFRIREEGYDWSPRRVCELRDAVVMGEDGLVADSEGNFVDESIKSREPWESAEKYVFERPEMRFRAAKRRKGLLPFGEPTRLENAMSMVGTHTDGHYGHWLLEYLPMLLHLSVYEENTGREPDIIVDKDAPDWMLETLRILGYDDERFVRFDDEFALVDRLVLPFSSVFAYSPKMIRMSPVEYRWLREWFLESVDGTDTSANERFYLSRQGVDRRQITNFDEIEPVLEEFGIEAVRPETMSVEEQVRKFSRGGLFIGPSGSGLHNTLFAKNAKTVEIFAPDVRQHAQYLLDTALGHEHTSVFGSFHDGDRSKGRKYMSFQVNPEALRKVLREVLSDAK